MGGDGFSFRGLLPDVSLLVFFAAAAAADDALKSLTSDTFCFGELKYLNNHTYYYCYHVRDLKKVILRNKEI